MIRSSSIFQPFAATLLGGVLLGILPSLSRAEELTPGHSVHGESFSEGPRRFATVMGNTGSVDFPVKTTNGEAQVFFNQGVGQLHGFWYYEAERSFRQVLHLDPNCTMAYWGMAMANIENEPRAREFIKKAAAKLEGAPEKEQLWIRSLEKFYKEKKDDGERKAAARQLVRDWEELAEKFPDDLEPRAFLAGLLWWNSSRRGLEITSHLAVDALLDQVLTKNPAHPAHHYVIHLWDGEKAERALRSAAESGATAGNIAHMWHMPAHIYNKTQRWQDAAYQQEAAHRIDHRFMIRQATMPDQIHNYAHNAEWLCRTLGQVGRVGDSLAVARNMIEQPLIPRSSAVKEKPSQVWNKGGNTAWSQGRDRLLDTLLAWEKWHTIIDWAATPYLEPNGEISDRLKRQHAIGLAHLRLGKVAEGKLAQANMEALLQEAKDARTKAGEDAENKALEENKNVDEISRLMTAAMLPQTRELENLRRPLREIACEVALAEGKADEAKKLREKLRDKDLPPVRRIALDWRLGEKDKALKSAEEWAKDSKGEVLPNAVLVDLLVKAEKKDEAKTKFELLRDLAATADLDTPVMQRLAPLAKECGAPDDWRKPLVQAKDVAERKPMAEFGPLLWDAGPAPAWTAISGQPAANGDPQIITNSELAGKPHILIFFLGKGCAHCVQQLQAFEPIAKKFTEAGIGLHAISTDSPQGVQDTLALAKTQGGFPFPIYSDAHGSAFRAFHAWDDFENKALHGTFLVDGDGSLRWQHISFEPFMEGEFLLKEAQRLLRM